MAFTHENFFIFQMQLTRKRMAVPDNRDYIAGREAQVKSFEATRAPLEPVAF